MRTAFNDAQLSTTTITRNGYDNEKWIGYASYDIGANEGVNAPLLLTIAAMGEEKYVTLEELDTSIEGTWTGFTYPSRYRVTVELAQDSDAVDSITTGPAGIPLPLEFLVALHSNEGAVMPDLYAMSEDDGFVATMMLNADTGLYVRYSGQWHKITNDDVVDGLTVTDVDGAALEMFDQFDRAGQLVHVSAMSKNGEPVQQYEIVPAGPAPVGEGPVTAAAATRAVPVLAGADDVPAAIAAAEENPDLRWWVERRLLALGLDAEIPWDPS